MASEGYYAATESLVLDTEVDHFGPLGHALWSIIANMYHHSGEWILNSLSEQDRQWEHSYRLVNINDSTTIDDLLQTQQLKVAPNKIQDVDDTFCIAVRNSGIPVPRWSSGVGQRRTSFSDNADNIYIRLAISCCFQTSGTSPRLKSFTLNQRTQNLHEPF